jgi:predicted DNA-binding transcriptional regulator AlpA
MNQRRGEPEVLTISGVSYLTAISEAGIRRALRARRFPAPFRVGRAVRWHRADITRFLAERAAAAQAEARRRA